MKAQFTFSDEELKMAVVIVRDALLEAMPTPSEIHYDLSANFIRKMDALCIRARHKAFVKTALQRVAMFFVAILIALGAWLTIDAEARGILEPILKLVRITQD